MSAGAYAGPRNCPKCNDLIPPGRPALCPSCRHPLVFDDQVSKDGKQDALVATRLNKPMEAREPDDTLPSSTPLVPAYLRPKPVASPGTQSTSTPVVKPPADKPPAAKPPTAQPPPPPPPKRTGRTIALVAMAMVLAVALGYVAFRVARPLVGPAVSGPVTAGPSTSAPPSPSLPSPTPTPSTDPSSTPTPEPEPDLKRIKNVTAEASSTLPPDNYTYDVENTLDRDPMTAWNSDGDVVRGSAPVTLTYRFSKPVDLREIEIYNGYQRSDETFNNNSRVRQLLVTTDATEESFKLKDKQGKQTIAHDFGETDKVVLTIEEVYRDDTTKYEDCAISEVTFFRV